MNIHSPIPTHDLALAHDFLKKLDPNAKQFCFALFADYKPATLPPIQHTASLGGFTVRLIQLNSIAGGYGAFVAVNETDGRGRTSANITRARALWADCDSTEAFEQALATCKAANIEPSWITRTSGGKGHLYFFIDDLTLEDFDRYEPLLVKALNGDPQAKDRPRVLRLPGTLHLKETPQLVTGEGNGKRYTLAEVANAFDLDEALRQAVKSRLSNSYTYRLEEIEASPLFGQTPSSVFADEDPCYFDELSAGLIEDTLARVFQAGLILAVHGNKLLSTRDGWRDYWLFPLARLVVENPEHVDAIKEIFDEINEKAGGSTINNEVEWRNAVQGTAVRLLRGEPTKGIGSLFNKAAEFSPISPEALKAHAKNISHSWAVNGTISKVERYDDIGNGRRLARLYGENIRYIGDANFWRLWDGDRWRDDKSRVVDHLAISVVEEMHRRADELLGDMKDALIKFSKKGGKAPDLTPDQEKGRGLKAWAKQSSSKGLIQAMVYMAQHLCIAHQLDFDRDPMLLGIQNGAIDLATGRFRVAAREDYLTKQAGASYASNAQCPNWLAFLAKIMGGDQDLVDYLQRAIGYTVTGSVSEEVMFVMYGRGANGKTTFIETITDLLGEYTTACDASLLMRQHAAGGGASPDIAKLKGARLVTVNETEEGAVLNEDRMKYLVSKSKIAARNLYSDPIVFTPTHKIWLATNHKPTIKSSDLGTWRRLHLIPFRVTFSADERVADFKEKYLLPEMSGILNWAIAGALAYQVGGLQPPKKITDATEAYRDDLDFMTRWIEENCEADDPQLPAHARTRTKLSHLHRNFRMWASWEKVPDLTANRFVQELELRGFEMFKSANGNQRMIRGLKNSPRPRRRAERGHIDARPVCAARDAINFCPICYVITDNALTTRGNPMPEFVHDLVTLPGQQFAVHCLLKWRHFNIPAISEALFALAEQLDIAVHVPIILSTRLDAFGIERVRTLLPEQEKTRLDSFDAIPDGKFGMLFWVSPVDSPEMDLH